MKPIFPHDEERYSLSWRCVVREGYVEACDSHEQGEYTSPYSFIIGSDCVDITTGYGGIETVYRGLLESYNG